jgi:hypothetical protein
MTQDSRLPALNGTLFLYVHCLRLVWIRLGCDICLLIPCVSHIPIESRPGVDEILSKTVFPWDRHNERDNGWHRKRSVNVSLIVSVGNTAPFSYWEPHNQSPSKIFSRRLFPFSTDTGREKIELGLRLVVSFSVTLIIDSCLSASLFSEEKGRNAGQPVIDYCKRNRERYRPVCTVFVFALLHAKTTPINMGDRQ